MAIKVLSSIADEAIRVFGIEKCFMAHRTGFVPVSQSSLIVACTGSHRRDPHDAVMFCVNQVKSRVPVWKKAVPLTPPDVVQDTNHKQLESWQEWSSKSEAFWLQTSSSSSSKDK